VEKALSVMQTYLNGQYLFLFQQHLVSERGREKSNESLGQVLGMVAPGSTAQ
jgi:hypothetical protein